MPLLIVRLLNDGEHLLVYATIRQSQNSGWTGLHRSTWERDPTDVRLGEHGLPAVAGHRQDDLGPMRLLMVFIARSKLMCGSRYAPADAVDVVRGAQ
jgi:hypothetical protein